MSFLPGNTLHAHYWILSTVALLVLQGCSSGSGGGGSSREIDLTTPLGSGEFVYDGPAPASEEIQNFKISFYDPLVADNRCGECHTSGGTASTAFVDRADVNRAWQEARTVVNLLEPTSSAVVQRVENGHNCWLGNSESATCAATVSSYVERWAAGSVQSTTSVQLVPRNPVMPTGTRVLPATLTEVAQQGLDLNGGGELLELLNRYCDGCHSDSAQVPQSPFFASDNADIAYAALRRNVDLVNPPGSRIVLRLNPESHNCWDDCAANASTMRAAIERLAAIIPLTNLDPDLLVSTAQVLDGDGIVANGGGRFESNLIAKWEFREGAGSTTADTSGLAPEMPLSLSGSYSWLGGWGIRLSAGKAQAGVSASRKLYDLISATGEYTVEAWVAPNNISQEEAWIVGYAGGPDNRNMLLSQSLYNYQAFNRSSVTADNSAGEPALSTADADELAQATLQHVVLTYDPIVGRSLYVNGVESGVSDVSGAGLLNNWSESFALVLGNATGNTNPWAGTMRMVAIHNSALKPEQVEQNFDVGVGQKFYLLFSVAELLNMEGTCHQLETGGARTHYCYIVFEVSQFDDSSYLFNAPFFANINPAGGQVQFALKGIRLGINGKLASIGQGFLNVRKTINLSGPGAISPMLSNTGSTIPLENGADQDRFFLAFDEIADQLGIPLDGDIEPFQQSLTGTGGSDVAVRTFDEINTTFSALTGVPVSHPAVSSITGKTVAQTYASIRRQLPGVESFQAFMSSHQMAATQLAAAYCDALAQDTNLRESVFPAPPIFSFNAPVSDSTIDWRNHIAAPLIDRALNRGLVDPVTRSAMLDEIELLITDDRDLKPYILLNGDYVSDPNPAAHNKRDGLIYCRNDSTCPPSRTADVVKAACTAVLGSAAAILQ